MSITVSEESSHSGKAGLLKVLGLLFLNCFAVLLFELVVLSPHWATFARDTSALIRFGQALKYFAKSNAS